MMKLILKFFDSAADAIGRGADIDEIVALEVREKIGRFKYVPEADIDAEFEQIEARLAHEVEQSVKKEVV